MKWTKEQLEAIETEGKNILISAGAGSGKTAVLTERIYQKLKRGININELLVLTFTKAAATSMKNKIRKRIKKDPELKKQLELLETSYITTFDSFALSIVKKYHTNLNITNKVTVTDNVIIEKTKEEILDNIFENYYNNPTNEFINLINNFVLKNDNNLKKNILKIYSKIELKPDIKDYLKNYINKYFSNEYLNEVTKDYLKLLKEIINNIDDLVEEIRIYSDGTYYNKIYNSTRNLINSKNYQEIKLSANFDMGRLSKPTEEEKLLKEQIKKEKDKLLDLITYKDEKEMIEEILETKENIKIIIEILLKLYNELTKYKEENSIYNFNDLAHMAIKVVKENKEIQEELIKNFNEILIDEYQDTSDTQEEFINLIANNNIYMVGDIKQSIYKFRNANPNLFKNKYNLYETTNKGIKIDLLKNFRSRSEVLDDINKIFNKVMNDKYGGADYIKTHQMIHGNDSYNVYGKTENNNNLEIYEYEKYSNNFKEEEYEAFIIGKDIKEKIKNKYKVFDKEENIIKPVEYKDFIILIDKGKNFDLYKKIFNYLSIPLSIEREENLVNDIDILVIRNLFKLILNIYKKEYNIDFRYNYTSIARSFLYKLTDQEIYNISINNSYKETQLYKKCLNLLDKINKISLPEFYNLVLNEFEYEKKLIEIGNINSYLLKQEYIYNILVEYNNKGLTIEDFVTFLDYIDKENKEIKYNINKINTNTVKIMTIHKSKGLEFPICYFTSFKSKFNLKELNEKIIYNNNYGIIIPKINNYYKNTILKNIVKQQTKEEEIGERIRLLYVALTRAEEKMIVIVPKQEKLNMSNYSNYNKSKYNSFLNILESIYKYIENQVIEKQEIINKDYLLLKEEKIANLKLKEDKLKVKELEITNQILEQAHYSKEVIKRKEKEEINNLKTGTKIHEIFELYDFKENINNYNIDKNIKEKIINFTNSDIIKENINNKFIKEYEFNYIKDNKEYTGIIDLLIEREDKYIIIDYKLSNINDENYDKQLNGYREYIEQKTNKKVICYLYSINENIFREVYK